MQKEGLFPPDIKEIFFSSQKSKTFSMSWFLSGLILAVNWGLGYFGMPHVLTKFMGIQDPEKIKLSQRIGLSWQSLALFSAFFIGCLAHSYIPHYGMQKETFFIIYYHSYFCLM